jgi:hypothetical protein
MFLRFQEQDNKSEADKNSLFQKATNKDSRGTKLS